MRSLTLLQTVLMAMPSFYHLPETFAVCEEHAFDFLCSMAVAFPRTVTSK